jgi:hypothetical protein
MKKNAVPQVRAYINGEIIHDSSIGLDGITEYTVNASFLSSGSNTATLKMTEYVRDYVFTNDRLRLELDDTTIFYGIIDDVKERISNDSIALDVVAANLTGWWSYSDAEPKTYNTTDNEIIKDILTQGIEQLSYFGFTSIQDIIDMETNTGFMGMDLGEAFRAGEYKVSTGKSFWDVMSEVANINGYYLYFNQSGKLLKETVSEVTQAVVPLESGLTETQVDFSKAAHNFDLEKDFEGTADIVWSIKSAKSDLWLWGNTATGKGKGKTTLSSYVQSPGTNTLSGLISKTSTANKSSASKKRSLYKQLRPDGLNEDSAWRGEGRSIDPSFFTDNPLYGNNFRRRKIISVSTSDQKQDLEKLAGLEWEKTAPTFEIDLQLGYLLNISLNDLVRVKYRDMEVLMVALQISYSDTPTSQSTKIKLKLTGRIR